MTAPTIMQNELVPNAVYKGCIEFLANRIKLTSEQINPTTQEHDGPIKSDMITDVDVTGITEEEVHLLRNKGFSRRYERTQSQVYYRVGFKTYSVAASVLYPEYSSKWSMSYDWASAGALVLRDSIVKSILSTSESQDTESPYVATLRGHLDGLKAIKTQIETRRDEAKTTLYEFISEYPFLAVAIVSAEKEMSKKKEGGKK